jgi:hypothetical protein
VDELVLGMMEPEGGGKPQRRELNGTGCSRVPVDREGRDGVNPSTTHLRVSLGKMCRRLALPPRAPCGHLLPHAHGIAKFTPLRVNPAATCPQRRQSFGSFNHLKLFASWTITHKYPDSDLARHSP